MGSAAGTAARQIRAVAHRAASGSKARPVAHFASFRTPLAQAGSDVLTAEDLSRGVGMKTAPPPGPSAGLLEPSWLRRDLRQYAMQGRITL
ncbi:hypothetical protein JCM8202_005257 [Rhodotorula sphaerocarpa]